MDPGSSARVSATTCGVKRNIHPNASFYLRVTEVDRSDRVDLEVNMQAKLAQLVTLVFLGATGMACADAQVVMNSIDAKRW